MPNLTYPFDQDLSFNSFIITNDKLVETVLGKHYTQNELVPVSYLKLIEQSLIVGTNMEWLPLQEYVFISDPENYGVISNEVTNNFQDGNLKLALEFLYSYWGTQLLKNTNVPWTTPLNAPLIVVTPTKTQLVQDTLGGNFHLILKFDIVTYVLPTSIYA